MDTNAPRPARLPWHDYPKIPGDVPGAVRHELHIAIRIRLEPLAAGPGAELELRAQVQGLMGQPLRIYGADHDIQDATLTAVSALVPTDGAFTRVQPWPDDVDR